MANIQERRDKTGKLVSYSVRVHRGRDADGKQLKPWTATFEVAPGWSEKTARKKAEAFAAGFEEKCRAGTETDTRLRFDAYCDYCIRLKEERGAKHTTVYNYRDFTRRIYPAIGHIKLRELRADHLNAFYSELSQDGQNRRTGGRLSAKSVLEYHRLIHAVLEQAVREGLVPFNVADRVEPPKAKRRDVNYFQPEQVEAIRDALEEEPPKWKMLVHLLLITGARRGELLGLKWDAVDYKGSRIHIFRTILYRPDRGVYEDTPKTKTSDRWIALPQESMQLLREFQHWQLGERLRLGELYEDQGYLFTQDNGAPMHPDSVTVWLRRFSERHGLPHINAHAFRHTMASMLFFNGVDSVSISKRLGHAQVSTTANIYAHVIQEADQRNADILEEIFLHPHTSAK